MTRIIDTIYYMKTTQKQLKCPYCKWTTVDVTNESGSFTKHLKNKHKLNPEDVIKTNPKMKKLWLKYWRDYERKMLLENDSKSRVKCLECLENGEEIYFKKISNTHLQNSHNMTTKEYKIKHNTDVICSDLTTNTLSINTTQHNLLNRVKRKTSKIEDTFESILVKSNIKYERSYKIDGKVFDFYIRDLDTVVEVDGIAYHKDRLSNMTNITIKNSINDFNKNNIIKNKSYKFKRIRISDTGQISMISCLNDLEKVLNNLSYIPNYELDVNSIIYSKEKIIKYKEIKGVDKVIDNLKMYIKFIRTFHPQEFPYPEEKKELKDIIESIKNFDTTKMKQDDGWNNNTSLEGVKYLKSNFKSYWKSNYKNKQSPYEVFNDDKLLGDVILNRMGVTHSETFDLSLKNIVQGMGVLRYYISFFKPIVASSIYKHFLGDNPISTVIDPCSGFGGRLLGFKSIYPNGTYIGIEPNIETFNELLQLKKELIDVLKCDENTIQLFNTTCEEFIENNPNIQANLTFTSIPYYDIEEYSNSISYKSFDDWKEKFIDNGINKYPNKVINLPHNLQSIIPNCTNKYYLYNNKSHFNKNDDKKQELVIQY